MALVQAPITLGFVVKSPTDDYLKLRRLPPVSIQGREHGEVVLECSAQGNPVPFVAWYKDGRPLTREDDLSGVGMGEAVARLVLPCLTKEDEGVYECRSKGGGRQVMAQTEVKVVEGRGRNCGGRGDKPNIGGWITTLMAEEGKTVRFPCRINNNVKDYSITWRDNKGKVVVKNNRRMTVTDNGDLFISRVGWEDMGQYTCSLSDLFGQDSVTTFIYPMAPDVG